MKESQRKKVEKRLLEERERTVRALERLDEAARISTEDDGELTQYSQHPADEGTDTMEQEKSLLLLSRDGTLLNLIDDALRRLYKEPETFGQCGNCGKDIDMARLDLLPWTQLCRDCKSAEEAG